MSEDLTSVLEDCRAAGALLRRVVSGLGERDLRGTSALPGWTRAHVLAHLTGVGDGAARQVEFARRDELIEFYDGGKPGRDAAIEAGAAVSLSEHRAQVDRMLDRVESVWPTAGSPLWEHRVAYRDGTVIDVVLTWWREIRIHLVDLDVDIGADTWSDDFCRHLFDFLTPRLPSDVPVELRFDDGGRWLVPNASTPGEAVVITGSLRDVAQWQAGRSPGRMPTASRGGQPQPLPELKPWPSPKR
ncbi:maleylpyruvate isomerase family mycothiol-dependent enzyme [Phytoactinopolyspora endophytica]|uniref:maleylpyruvate isomerase family mycothiol-dependent enzyme n=1 Tax=Phytoactinopolyspora endophytica TaxID=1642495 RepID=UPI0013EDB1E4|nr:maleylpyruvate isomerase family mycothiol-dependent enzyme [Phytoactinopolyspora endophytica]